MCMSRRVDQRRSEFDQLQSLAMSPRLQHSDPSGTSADPPHTHSRFPAVNATTPNHNGPVINSETAGKYR